MTLCYYWKHIFQKKMKTRFKGQIAISFHGTKPSDVDDIKVDKMVVYFSLMLNQMNKILYYLIYAIPRQEENNEIP